MTETHVRRTLPGWARFRGSGPLAVVALMAFIVPLLMAPVASVRWHGAKGLAFEIGIVLLLASAAWGVRSLDHVRVRRALARARSGPNPYLIGLAAWGLLSFALAPNKAFAFQGLLQLAGGILVYALVARARQRSQWELVLDALIGVTALASLLSFATFGQGGTEMAVGTFSDHQLLGAFLMLMLPVMLMTGFSPTDPRRRLAAQATAVLCALCLLLTRTRSSWIGEGVALLVLAVLASRVLYRPGARRTTGERRRLMAQYAGPALVFACALALFVGWSQMGGSFAQRARTLTTTVLAGQDGSFQGRLPAWRGAAAMIEARPLAGWGIGNYALSQERFTHVGRTGAAVAAEGPSLSEQAHNFYLQFAAEMGLPGLLAWIGLLGACFLTLGRSLTRPRGDGPRQWIVIGVVAAVAAQAADAAANPAWQYPEVMLFFWIILGLGMAAAQEPAREQAETARPQGAGRSPARSLGAKVQLAGVCVVSCVLLNQIVALACDVPAPCYATAKCLYIKFNPSPGVQCSAGPSLDTIICTGQTGAGTTYTLKRLVKTNPSVPYTYSFTVYLHTSKGDSIAPANSYRLSLVSATFGSLASGSRFTAPATGTTTGAIVAQPTDNSVLPGAAVITLD